MVPVAPENATAPEASVPPALETAGLAPLMALEAGAPEIAVALLDGPVALDHPDLAGADLRVLGEGDPTHAAHGTFVAGILVADRDSAAPGICPGCPLLVRPVLTAGGADPAALARALDDAVAAGARVVNVSAAFGPSVADRPELAASLAAAAAREVLVVAAAGNDAALASSVLTRHPAVLPVVATDLAGWPLPDTNLPRAAAVRGLAAPGTVASLRPDDAPATLSGTSVAAALVTGAAALLWSRFPAAGLAAVRRALAGPARRVALVPPALDAWAAHAALALHHDPEE